MSSGRLGSVSPKATVAPSACCVASDYIVLNTAKKASQYSDQLVPDLDQLKYWMETGKKKLHVVLDDEHEFCDPQVPTDV